VHCFVVFRGYCREDDVHDEVAIDEEEEDEGDGVEPVAMVGWHHDIREIGGTLQSKHHQNSVKTASKQRQNSVKTASKQRQNSVKTALKRRRNL